MIVRSIPAVLLAVLMAAGCTGKAEDQAKPAAAKPAVASNDKADPAASPSAATPAGHEADADGKGCIYAEGEKGNDPSCPHPGGEGAEPQGPASGEGHFGQAFTKAEGEAKPLGEVLAQAEIPEGPLLIRGEVEAVCQKKGCWMVVKDGDKSARVLMKDHGFAVPMDCRGKTTTIEGTLASRTFNEAQVKHLEKDGGGDPSKVSGERTEHVLTASGVRIQS